MSLDKLNDKEKQVLKDWHENPNYRPLSVKTAMEMYELFLAGCSCEEIHRLNEDMKLGMILDARVKHNWDERRDKHLEELYGGIPEKLMKTQVESAAFISDVIAATHKKYSKGLKKYLQTGDEKILPGGIIPDSPQTYNKLMDTLARIKEDMPTIKVPQVTEEGEKKVVIAAPNSPLAKLKFADSEESVLDYLASTHVSDQKGIKKPKKDEEDEG